MPAAPLPLGEGGGRPFASTPLHSAAGRPPSAGAVRGVGRAWPVASGRVRNGTWRSRGKRGDKGQGVRGTRTWRVPHGHGVTSRRVRRGSRLWGCAVVAAPRRIPPAACLEGGGGGLASRSGRGGLGPAWCDGPGFCVPTSGGGGSLGVPPPPVGSTPAGGRGGAGSCKCSAVCPTPQSSCPR